MANSIPQDSNGPPNPVVESPPPNKRKPFQTTPLHPPPVTATCGKYRVEAPT